MDQAIEEQLAKFKTILRELDFDDVSIDDQLKKLSDLIVIATINRIAESKPNASGTDQIPDEQSIAKYLSDNFEDEQLKAILVEVSQDKISSYLSAILEDVDQAKREEILSKIQEDKGTVG